MVDYVPLLVRAVATLNPNTAETRHALYDRARKTLVDKLRAGDPALAHTDLRAERAALEAAIRQVEADVVRRASAPQSRSPHQVYDAPVQAYRDIPPLKDTRKRWRIVAGVCGALAILLGAAAVYSLWPRIVPGAREIVSQRSVSRPAEPPAASRGYVDMRQLVYFRTNYPAGTIIVDKSQTFLYVVQPRVAALRYSIGVGSECPTSAGLYHVSRKEEWPGRNQQATDAANDRVKNTLGARTLYLNKEDRDVSKDDRIHGSASPAIGQRVPVGCIQLANDDVIYLYDRTELGSRVVVLPE